MNSIPAIVSEAVVVQNPEPAAVAVPNAVVFAETVVPKPGPAAVPNAAVSNAGKDYVFTNHLQYAFDYYDLIRSKFSNQSEIYKGFENAMDKLTYGRIKKQGLVDLVSELFKGHDELIVGFDTFLLALNKFGFKTEEHVQPAVLHFASLGLDSFIDSSATSIVSTCAGVSSIPSGSTEVSSLDEVSTILNELSLENRKLKDVLTENNDKVKRALDEAYMNLQSTMVKMSSMDQLHKAKYEEKVAEVEQIRTENIKLKHEAEIQKLAYEKIEREKDALDLEYELSQFPILKLKNNNSTNQTEMAISLSRELSEQKQLLATSHVEVEMLQENLRRNEHELAVEKSYNAILRKELAQGQETRNTMPQNSDEDYNSGDESEMTSSQQKYDDASSLNERLEAIAKRLAICESQLMDGRKELVQENDFLTGTDGHFSLRQTLDRFRVSKESAVAAPKRQGTRNPQQECPICQKKVPTLEAVISHASNCGECCNPRTFSFPKPNTTMI